MSEEELGRVVEACAVLHNICLRMTNKERSGRLAEAKMLMDHYLNAVPDAPAAAPPAQVATAMADSEVSARLGEVGLSHGELRAQGMAIRDNLCEWFNRILSCR